MDITEFNLIFIEQLNHGFHISKRVKEDFVEPADDGNFDEGDM